MAEFLRMQHDQKVSNEQDDMKKVGIKEYLYNKSQWKKINVVDDQIDKYVL